MTITTVCRALLYGVCLGLSLFVSPALAHDEVVYFSGMLGGSFPGSFTNIHEVTGSFEPGTTSSDLALQNSLLYVAKAGIYSKAGIFGFEAEVFNTNPNIKQQQQTFHEPTSGPFVGTNVGNARVLTVAANLVARLPVVDNLTAKAGVGPAVLFAHLTRTNEEPQSSTRVGLNVLAGLEYNLAHAWKLFLEYKFTQAKFQFEGSGTTEGFKTNYAANAVAFGVSYAFDVALPWRGIRLKEILADR